MQLKLTTTVEADTVQGLIDAIGGEDADQACVRFGSPAQVIGLAGLDRETSLDALGIGSGDALEVIPPVTDPQNTLEGASVG